MTNDYFVTLRGLLNLSVPPLLTSKDNNDTYLTAIKGME